MLKKVLGELGLNGVLIQEVGEVFSVGEAFSKRRSCAPYSAAVFLIVALDASKQRSIASDANVRGHRGQYRLITGCHHFSVSLLTI